MEKIQHRCPTKIIQTAKCVILQEVTENHGITFKNLQDSIVMVNVNVHKSNTRLTVQKWHAWQGSERGDIAVGRNFAKGHMDETEGSGI